MVPIILLYVHTNRTPKVLLWAASETENLHLLQDVLRGSLTMKNSKKYFPMKKRLFPIDRCYLCLLYEYRISQTKISTR